MAEIKLTPQQRAAVEHRGSALLVSAAAGSGKTKVLIDRVLRRVEEEQRDVDDFLMITFTQAAASELRGKLIAQLSERLADCPENRHLQRQLSRVYLAQISTVHAFCAALLREYAHILELPADFRVTDEQEAETLRERAMQSILETAYTLVSQDAELAAALDMLGAGRDDRALPELILKIYAGVQCWSKPDERMQTLRETLDFSDIRDVGQTPWGAYLLEEFRAFLNGCERSLTHACEKIAASESLQGYFVTFSQNLELVRALKSAEGWEALRAVPLEFGRLKPIRNCPEPELQERLKADRKRVVDGIRTRMERFALPSSEAIADLECSAGALRGLLRLAQDFSEAYHAEKQRRHVLDYNDLEHETLRLLYGKGSVPTAAAREIGGRFAEIMIDEYQDTNAVQDAIFAAIATEGKNLFFVGDVKQSIYRFRLADPTIFLEKYRTFADVETAKAGEPCRILLSDNFRSHREILSAANDVFRQTMTPRVGGLHYGDAEALRPRREFADWGAPAVELHCIDMSDLPTQPPTPREQIEAEFVARRIARMIEDGEQIPDDDGLRPIRAEDVVILMRSVSGKAPIYREALRRHGIRSVCGSDDLFAAEEIAFLTAFLRVIDNPHQDIPLLTVLLSPVIRFSADDLALLRAQKRDGDLYDALCAGERAAEFLTMLNQLRDLAARETLHALLDAIDERCFVRAVYSAREGGEQRRQNIERLISLGDEYERGDRCGLPGFLRYLDGLRERGVSTEAEQSAGAVRLMSVHKSKGLEFPVVFLADLCKKFNTADATETVLVDPVLGIGASIYDPALHISYPTAARTAISDRIRKENLSEEMRVLYVAMTRAQYRMVMTCCARNLHTRLETLARDLPITDTMIESAGSIGDWVLMSALTRTESGALLGAEGNPEVRQVSDMPWRITMNDALALTNTEEAQETAETVHAAVPTLRRVSYPHAAAATAPSKLTATQLKGRTLDEEVASDAFAVPQLRFTKPSFEARPLSPTERGTAIHLAMQYADYAVCTSADGVRAELARLLSLRQLTPQQVEAVDPERIVRFFRSPLGERVLQSKNLVREFKFSVLEDAAIYDPSLAGETVLLQGVTDCCIPESDGLTILDFKSDRVRRGEESERAEYYRGQLDAYSRALSEIFERPVRERILYFFATDTAVKL